MILADNILETNFQITQPAELGALQVIQQFINAACQKHPQVMHDVRYDISLAVEEACANIIEHGYAGMQPGQITIELEFQIDQVIVCITDFGQSFNPNQMPTPDISSNLEERPVGGLGLYFIRQIMDEVHYQSSPEVNRLMLIKRNRYKNTLAANQ